LAICSDQQEASLAGRQPANLDEARQRLKRDYKRGPKRERKTENEEQLDAIDRFVKKRIACYLKASGYSYNYIADSLEVTNAIVKHWMLEPESIAEVQRIQKDIAGGAVNLMKTYAIEIIEKLMTIVRTEQNPRFVIQAAESLLDRMGLARVNKSESIGRVEHHESVDITDQTGIVEKLRSAPPELQTSIARKMEELDSLMKEAT
jgi:predicted transcriptional regulator